MALVWADGFDHYGTSPNSGRDNMLAGAWAQLFGSTSIAISSTQKRTGTHSLNISHNELSNSAHYARRVYGSSRQVCGIGFGLYLDYLPSGGNLHGLQFRDADNDKIASILYNTDGSFTVTRGGLTGSDGGVAIGSTDPAITAQAWHHIECKINRDEIVGSIEVRVNGRTVFNMTDLNLGTKNIATIAIGSFWAFGSSVNAYFDDLVVWDDNGAENNDFLGPQRVETIWPASDTAAADWSIVGTSSGYDALDGVPPDGDTSYIQADDAGAISEFGVSELPPKTSSIAGVYVPAMSRLDDAGIGDIKVSMVSGTDVAEGDAVALTNFYTYHGAAFPVDPATGAAWTKAGVEAALLRLEKTL